MRALQAPEDTDLRMWETSGGWQCYVGDTWWGVLLNFCSKWRGLAAPGSVGGEDERVASTCRHWRLAKEILRSSLYVRIPTTVGHHIKPTSFLAQLLYA